MGARYSPTVKVLWFSNSLREESTGASKRSGDFWRAKASFVKAPIVSKLNCLIAVGDKTGNIYEGEEKAGRHLFLRKGEKGPFSFFPSSICLQFFSFPTAWKS